jgi:hypothetical protein
LAAPLLAEKHIIGCALCGRIAKYNDARTSYQEWFNHMRREHNKYNAYHGDAMITMTILFEANDPAQPNQEIDRTDPLMQFFRTRDWMNERGLLIPKEPDEATT